MMLWRLAAVKASTRYRLARLEALGAPHSDVLTTEAGTCRVGNALSWLITHGRVAPDGSEITGFVIPDGPCDQLSASIYESLQAMASGQIETPEIDS